MKEVVAEVVKEVVVEGADEVVAAVVGAMSRAWRTDNPIYIRRYIISKT